MAIGISARRGRVAGVALLVAAGCVAASGPMPDPASRPDNRSVASSERTVVPYPTPGTGRSVFSASLTAAVAAVDEISAARPAVTVSVAIADRATERIAGNAAGTTPIYSASLVKIVLAIDVLQRRPVSAADLALLRRALGPSDDQAMNALWTRFDGPSAVSRVARQLGLAATRPPDDPSQWGQTPVSARDMLVVFRHILNTMPAADRELIMSTLAGAPPIAADGFDQAFGLAAVAPPVAAKQGWMCCVADRIQLHSVGTLGEQHRFVVALLSSHPADRGYDDAREITNATANAVAAALP